MLAGSKLGPGFFLWSLPRLAQQRCLAGKFTRCVQASAGKVVQWKGKKTVAEYDERRLVDWAERMDTILTGHMNGFTPKIRSAAAKYRPAGNGSHPHADRGRPARSALTQSPRGYQAAPRDENLRRRRQLLRVLLAARTVSEAWEAYEDLITEYPYNPLQKPVIPYGHLHCLAGRLAAVKPRTRSLYLKFASVLATLRRTGGRVYIWEWNTLIDCAGKQWRKTSLTDYRAALDILSDMKTPPHLLDHSASGDPIIPSRRPSPPTSWAPVKPDVTTYTVLLSIAVRSKQHVAVRHALKLLRLSGFSPTRYTHLIMLRFYARTNQLSEVRSTLHRMKQQGVEVGLIGLNTCIWAFSSNGRVDLAYLIYRVLRHNVVPETGSKADDVAAAARYLRDTERLDIPPDLKPNQAVYTSMIQCSAYQGNVVQALHVFTDMLSMPSPHPPSLAAFRAIFLGFYRHGRKLGPVNFTGDLTTREQHLPELSSWNLENLKLIFKAFMDLPEGYRLNGRIVYWIIVAFGRLSGNNPTVMHNVWEQLEAKYGRNWGGRLERVGRAIHSSKTVDRRD